MQLDFVGGEMVEPEEPGVENPNDMPRVEECRYEN
jgi:hypothetical protein